MALKVAFQTDPLETLDTAGDSGLEFMQGAAARGFTLFHYRPQDLSLSGNIPVARVRPIRLAREDGLPVSSGPLERMELGWFDIIMMRQDPPFDLAYIAATHILERVPAPTRVINAPRAVRDAPEKILAMDFPDLMAPTLISRDMEEIADFRARHEDIVVKPLFGHGGASVFRLTHSDTNFGALMDVMLGSAQPPLVCQKFLPEVWQGDKRIMLIDGEYAGALNRKPASGEIRANMVQGGNAAICDIDDRERAICAQLGPRLKEMGLIIAGIDVIGGFLTEINVTAPTGFRAFRRLGGASLAARFWDIVES